MPSATARPPATATTPVPSVPTRSSLVGTIVSSASVQAKTQQDAKARADRIAKEPREKAGDHERIWPPLSKASDAARNHELERLRRGEEVKRRKAQEEREKPEKASEEAAWRAAGGGGGGEYHQSERGGQTTAQAQHKAGGEEETRQARDEHP